MIEITLNEDRQPIHDHFYRWISENPEVLETMVQGTFVEEDQEVEIDDVEFEYTNSAFTGYWDVKFYFTTPETPPESRPHMVVVEYKTGLEESRVEDILRQIKKRRETVEGRSEKEFNKNYEHPEGDEIFDYTRAGVVLTSFDHRFEAYRSVFENEDVELVLGSPAEAVTLKPVTELLNEFLR